MLDENYWSAFEIHENLDEPSYIQAILGCIQQF